MALDVFPMGSMMPKTNLLSPTKILGSVTLVISPKDTFGKMSFLFSQKVGPSYYFLNVQVYAYARET